MNSRLIRAVAATALLTTATAPLGCGYILYPERRGTQSGRIDSGTMVMDLLWLLPGLIPGVVALIVDFSSGAIYVRGSASLRLGPDGRVAVRLPRASMPTRLEFRLVTASHRVVAQKTALIGPSSPDGQALELEVDDSVRTNAPGAAARTSGQIFLEVQNEKGTTARFPTSMELVGG